MKTFVQKLGAGLVGAALALAGVAPVAMAGNPESGPDGVERVSGDNRFQTAIAVSKAYYKPGVKRVYVANGLNFPDALAGAGSAGLQGDPLLLVDPAGLSADIKSEIRRLGPTREVVFLGGYGVIPKAIEDDVMAQVNPSVKAVRRAGDNRFGTAANIAVYQFPWETDMVDVFLVNGMNFPDALAASAASGSMQIPVLLTMDTVLPAETIDALKQLNVRKVFVVGGDGVVSKEVASQAGKVADAPVQRIWGPDRFSTAAQVANYFWPVPDVDGAVVSNGRNFPDALVGSAVAGKFFMPVLLTDKETVPGDTYDFLQQKDIGEGLIVTGGSGVVSDAVFFTLQGAIRDSLG